MLREGLIHDQNQLCARLVRVGKVTPAQQRNPHRAEVVAGHLRDGGQVHVRALGRCITLDHEALVIVVAGIGQEAGEAHARSAGQLA